MNNINNAFINALLADATYALDIDGYKSPSSGDSTDLVNRLSSRMTPTLAKYIGDNFTVVDHIESDDTTGSGFDATVWRRKNDGKIFVTMQGTQGFGDFMTDADLTLGNGAPARQIVDMVNWWLRISTPSGVEVKQLGLVSIPLAGNLLPSYFYETASVEGEGLITAGAQVTVNGHSLGGALASSFAQLFNGSSVAVNDVATYNSAGYGWWAPVLFSQIKDLLPAGNGFVGYAHTNYFAENGISATTREFINTHLGNRVPLSQEESTLAIYENHFMYKITDLLALGDVMSVIDPTLNLSTLNKVVKAGASEPEELYELVLDGLRKIVGLYDDAEDATPIGDAGDSAESRKKYYENLFELKNNSRFNSLANKVLITDKFIGYNPQQDYSQFLALYYLTPFVLEAPESLLKTFNVDLYAAWHADTALTAEERAAGKANFSDIWYQDRASMREAMISRNTEDDMWDYETNKTPESIEYTDEVNDVDIYSVTKVPLVVTRQSIIFGNEKADTLNGLIWNDRLYGGAGNDTLNGKAGHDYLEGNSGNDSLYGGDGADQLYGGTGNDQLVGEGGNDILIGGEGNDTYLFTGQFGRDIIKDSDGLGTLEFSSVQLSQLLQSAKDSIVYYDDLNNPTKKAVVIDEGNTKSLIISTVTKNGNQIIDSGNSVTIKNWSAGNLGLTLTPYVQTASTANVVTLNGNGGDNALSYFNKTIVQFNKYSRDQFDSSRIKERGVKYEA